MLEGCAAETLLVDNGTLVAKQEMNDVMLRLARQG